MCKAFWFSLPFRFERFQMNFTVITFIFYCFVYGESLDWKDKNIGNTIFSETENEIERARCPDQQDEFCKNSQDMSSSLLGNFMKKKASAYSFSVSHSRAYNAPVIKKNNYLRECQETQEFSLFSSYSTNAHAPAKWTTPWWIWEENIFQGGFCTVCCLFRFVL